MGKFFNLFKKFAKKNKIVLNNLWSFADKVAKDLYSLRTGRW